MSVLSQVLLSFSLVFVAEMGDKTQLATLGMTARYGPSTVFAGVAIGAALVNLVSATLGAAVASAVPLSSLRLLAGAFFICLGLWSIWKSASGRKEGDNDSRLLQRHGAAVLSYPAHPAPGESGPGTSRLNAVGLIAAGFFLAEVGDKTMLTTAAIAIRFGGAVAWIGSTLALMAASFLAIAAGGVLKRYLAPKHIRLASALAFLGFGAAALLETTFY